MKYFYTLLGRPAASSFFTAKRAFRGLGYFFAALATLANASDAFNIAQTIVLPFFFTGLDFGAGLIAFSALAAVAVSILYIYQEGISVVEGTEKLPGAFSQFFAWLRGEKAVVAEVPKKPLTTKQKAASFAVESITSGISFLVSSFWALSVFAGMIALIGAMGFGSSPLVLSIAALTGAAQFSACFFQEGSNFMRRVHDDLERWFGVSPKAETETGKKRPPPLLGVVKKHSVGDELPGAAAGRLRRTQSASSLLNKGGLTLFASPKREGADSDVSADDTLALDASVMSAGSGRTG